MRLTILFILVSALPAVAAERQVDPTFLHRRVDDVAVVKSDLTTQSCRYKPLFGAGDEAAGLPKGVKRFGVMVVEPGGKSAEVDYDAEEQIYYVLDGKGAASYRGELAPIRKGDFMYFAPGTAHGAVNDSGAPLRIAVMGYVVDKDKHYAQPVKLPLANEAEAKKQVVGNHPASTLYELLLGDTTSQRDLLSVADRVTSLFIMEFTSGGTNFPHHHLRDEEIYLVLEGKGEMVAGGGMDGVEGRHSAGPGDAYYYRPNATVGFYNDDSPGAKTARILAIRSRFPGLE